MTTIRAALVVQNCPVKTFNDNLSRTLDTIDRAADLKADIIVFPEMNLTGYAAGDVSLARPLDPEWVEKLSRAARRLDMTILTGLAEKAENGRVYATHLVTGPNQSPVYYRKIHLSPFEASCYTPGNTVRLFTHKGIRFGIQLCYDAHFPELATAMSLKQADIIFIPHASPRGTSEDKYISWMRHLPARAFDNGVFVAAVNQTGDNGTGLNFPGLAMVLGPDGRLVSKKMDGGIHIIEMDMADIERVRSHKMRYFLPNRRPDLI